MNDFARKPSTSAMLSPAQVAGLTNLSVRPSTAPLNAASFRHRGCVDGYGLTPRSSKRGRRGARCSGKGRRKGRSGPDAPTQAHLPSSMSCSRLGERARERLAYARRQVAGLVSNGGSRVRPRDEDLRPEVGCACIRR